MWNDGGLLAIRGDSLFTGPMRVLFRKAHERAARGCGGSARGSNAMKATIWHNPACGTSRKTLAILEQMHGVELTVIEYLKNPPERATLARLFQRAGITPREGLRVTGSPAEALGLTAEGVSDEAILDAMVKEPILINRPLVETDKGVRLCRPQDRVHEIL
jgi:arsenate reductase